LTGLEGSIDEIVGRNILQYVIDGVNYYYLIRNIIKERWDLENLEVLELEESYELTEDSIGKFASNI
jgi:hypothetical protein